MAVAVRLVEVLTLITILGLITCLSLTVTLAERAISLIMTFLGPAASMVQFGLLFIEKILVYALLSILGFVKTVIATLRVTGLA
ncbi:uncharacterized protein LOC117586729 [Drosophila guanche]|uniref:Uncharacterized protein n=1 Tax=Drosophila guanche TaxID=7266 RepID=A0A3B0JWG2_DROGU|nr:uncharacterized protein LOC117586729 [Drosophila guanche]SPP75418.1 Hypothetical predicted protein [Drosophila guanche]